MFFDSNYYDALTKLNLRPGKDTESNVIIDQNGADCVIDVARWEVNQTSNRVWFPMYNSDRNLRKIAKLLNAELEKQKRAKE